MGLSGGKVLLSYLFAHARLMQGRQHSQEKSERGRSGGPTGVPLEPYIGDIEFVLGPMAQGGGELESGLAEARLAKPQTLSATRPSKIEIQRLFGKGAQQVGGARRRPRARSSYRNGPTRGRRR